MQLSLNSTHTAVRSNKSPRASSSGIFRLTIEAIRYSSSTLPLSFFLFLVISSCLQNVASGPNDPVPVTAQELSYSAVNPDYRAYVLCRGTFPLAANSYTPININIGAVPCPDGYNYIKTNIDNNGLNNKPFFWRDPSDTSGGPQGTRPSDLYVFPPQRDDYCSYSSTSVTCLALGGQPINPTKHRRDEVNEDESELQAGGSQSHLERRCGGWAQSSFTFMNSLPKNLCFVTTDDLLAANLPKDTTTPGGPYTMNPATYPCGNRNDYSLSKCSISGLVEVGDPNNFLTYNIAYACYSTDSNVNYCGASSCQMIKMAHGAVDSAADTFILGFKRYMTSNPSIWRHCWSYPSQPSNFPPTQKKGGGINLDKIAPLFSVFKQGETNSRASDITYKWGGNHFKNVGCVRDGKINWDPSRYWLAFPPTTAGMANSFDAFWRDIGSQIPSLTYYANLPMSVSKCTAFGAYYGFSYCGVGGGYCYCDHAPNMVNPFPDYFDIYGVPVSNICTRTCDAPYDKENCGGSGTLANGLNYELSTIYRVGRHDSNPGNCNNTQNLIVDGEFDLGCSTGGCIGAGSVKSNSWRSWTIKNAACIFSLNPLTASTSALPAGGALTFIYDTAVVSTGVKGKWSSMGYPYGSWIVKFSASNPTYITQTFNTQSNQFYLISMNVRNTFTGTKNYNSPKTLFVRITSGGNVLELGMLWTFRDTIIRSNAEFQFAQDIRDDGMQQASIYAHIFVTPQGSTSAKVEIWNMNDTASYPSFSYDTFVDNIRVVKLDPVQKYMSNRLDTDLSFECPNTSPMDYADGETIQCINQNSGFYRFNKTVYSLWEANPTTRASNPFLRSYGKDAKGFNPTNLNYYKIFDCSVKWGATAFGSPLIFKYPLSCDVYSPPNLVVNGGFESNCKNTNPAFSGSYSIYGHCDPNTLSNVTNQLTGWSTGYQDVIHNPGLEPLVTLANGFLLNSSVKPSTVASFAGSFSVALFTFKSSSSAVPVRIHQVINFTRGTYRLSFRVRPTPGVAWTSGTTAAAATVAIRSQNVVAGYCPGNYPGNCPTWGPYFMSPTNISYYSNNWTLINLEFSIHDASSSTKIYPAFLEFETSGIAAFGFPSGVWLDDVKIIKVFGQESRDCFSCTTQINLVQNGGFENHACTLANGWCNLGTLPFWTSNLSSNPFEVDYNPWPAYAGSWSMDLNPGEQNTISQMIANVEFGYYELSFWFMNRQGHSTLPIGYYSISSAYNPALNQFRNTFGPISTTLDPIYTGQCFQDTPTRLLSTLKPNVNWISECLTHCAGFKYAGVEYGGNCMCGNSFGINLVPLNTCTFRCPGNEICGGNWAISVFTVPVAGWQRLSYGFYVTAQESFTSKSRKLSIESGIAGGSGPILDEIKLVRVLCQEAVDCTTQINLVQNGGFENHTCALANGICYLVVLPFWTSNQNYNPFEVDYGRYPAYSGSWSIDLNPSDQSTIYQFIDNVAFGYYELSFWYMKPKGVSISVSSQPFGYYSISSVYNPAQNQFRNAFGAISKSTYAGQSGQCFQDGTTRLLSTQKPNVNSVQECFTHCAGFIYAGLNGIECWCGNSFGRSLVPVTTCPSRCTSNEVCGGFLLISVFDMTETGWTRLSYEFYVTEQESSISKIRKLTIESGVAGGSGPYLDEIKLVRVNCTV